MQEVNWELLSRYLAGECSRQETQWVQEWLRTSEANRKHFDEVKRIWESAEETTALQAPDLELAWQKVDRATSKRKTIPLYNPYLRIAASFLILTVLGILFYFSAFHTRQLTATTQAKEKKEIQLPDGSHIWLNENSSIQYPENFGGNLREVVLKGEAFFEVTRNEMQPFLVNTGNSITKVLGTSFNIRETQGEAVEIQVVSGKVAFYNREAEEKNILLQAGETGQLATVSLQPVKGVNSETNFLSWHTEILHFKNTPLHEVLPQIEKYYQKKVILENNELRACLLTSSFEKRSLEEVLQTLQTIYGLSYRVSTDTIYLSGGGC